MITTLDQLHEHVSSQKPLYKRRKWIKETKVFVLLFIAIYALHTVVVNYEVIAMSLVSDDIDTELITQVYEKSAEQESKQNKVIQHTVAASPQQTQQSQEKLGELRQQLLMHQPVASSDFQASYKLESSLRQRLNDYSIKFNRLPPSNRLVIPKIWVDVPINDIEVDKPINQLTRKDFDSALYKWVVKYPSTPWPSNNINNHPLIFGHTSFEPWKNNLWWSIFGQLPKLQHDDIIQSVWNGTLYTYKVIEKRVIHPSQINSMYMEYTNGNYISLVGCYPIGTTKDRLVVVAELVENAVFAKETLQ